MMDGRPQLGQRLDEQHGLPHRGAGEACPRLLVDLALDHIQHTAVYPGLPQRPDLRVIPQPPPPPRAACRPI